MDKLKRNTLGVITVELEPGAVLYENLSYPVDPMSVPMIGSD